MNNRSIIEGGIIAFLLSFLAGIIVVLFLGGISAGFLAVILVGVNWLCLLAGGWWASTRAKKIGLFHGALSGLVYVNISIPLNIFLKNTQELSIPIVLVSLLNSTLWGAIGGFLAERKYKR